MPSITPMLDTMLTDVSGRAGDKATYVRRQTTGPIAGVRLIDPHGLLQRQDTPDPDLSTLRLTEQLKTPPGARDLYIGRLNPSGTDHQAAPANSSGAVTISSNPSSHGSTIAQLLQSWPSAPTIRGDQTLMDSTASGMPSVAGLANQLSHVLTTSGLFFESQMLAWVRGKISKSQVIKNPQAQAHDSSAAGTRSASSHSANLASSLDVCFRQQLEFLDTGVFHWQGPAWPGAELEWQLQRDERPVLDHEPAFRSSIRLTTANLGLIEAQIHHTNARLGITTWADRDAVSQLLARHSGALEASLSGLGYENVEITCLSAPSV